MCECCPPDRLETCMKKTQPNHDKVSPNCCATLSSRAELLPAKGAQLKNQGTAEANETNHFPPPNKIKKHSDKFPVQNS